jgi:hypothetical protein
MKKVSTTLAKQSRKNSQQKLIVGLDLGDRNSWYCMLDEESARLRKGCRRSSARCRAVASHWKPEPTRLGSVVCGHSTDTGTGADIRWKG